jgi:hypothetical protein
MKYFEYQKINYIPFLRVHGCFSEADLFILLGYVVIPSKLAQAVSILTCIRDVPSPSADTLTSMTDFLFMNFLSSSRQVLGWYLEQGHDHFF